MGMNTGLKVWLQKSVDKKHGPWRKRLCKKVLHPPTRTNTKQTAEEDTERAVKKEVMGRATIIGIPLWRQQSGIVMLGQQAIHLAPKGAADLTGFLPGGRRLEVEVKKRGGGVQSPDQKSWQEFVEGWGGVYLLVCSGDEFEEKITHFIQN